MVYSALPKRDYPAPLALVALCEGTWAYASRIRGTSTQAGLLRAVGPQGNCDKLTRNRARHGFESVWRTDLCLSVMSLSYVGEFCRPLRDFGMVGCAVPGVKTPGYCLAVPAALRGAHLKEARKYSSNLRDITPGTVSNPPEDGPVLSRNDDCRRIDLTAESAEIAKFGEILLRFSITIR